MLIPRGIFVEDVLTVAENRFGSVAITNSTRTADIHSPLTFLEGPSAVMSMLESLGNHPNVYLGDKVRVRIEVVGRT